jgi:hypothetical protein
VPIKLKSAVLLAIASSDPSQSAHPSGAKFPANARISPMYDSDIAASFWRRGTFHSRANGRRRPREAEGEGSG